MRHHLSECVALKRVRLRKCGAHDSCHDPNETRNSMQALHRSSFLLMSFPPSFCSITSLFAANLTGRGIVVSLSTLCSMLLNAACISIDVAVSIAMGRIGLFVIAMPTSTVIIIDVAILRLLLTRWLLVLLSIDKTIASNGYVYDAATYAHCYCFVSGYGYPHTAP